jgi:hypothetical protein
VKVYRKSIEKPPPSIMTATAMPAQKASSSVIMVSLNSAHSNYGIFNTYESQIHKHQSSLGKEATLNVKPQIYSRHKEKQTGKK